MGRQAKYSTAVLLDAAAEIVAAQGPAAVTMTAVARSVGAPSGSIYHRFADRSSLQAMLWLRVISSFHAAVVPHLDAPPAEAAVAGARATVRWCRDEHDLACVLIAGREAFSPDSWSEHDAALVDAEQLSFERRVQVVVRELKRGDSGISRDRLALAALDLPYAAVRRYLGSGRRVPRTLDAVVESAARALLVPDLAN